MKVPETKGRLKIGADTLNQTCCRNLQNSPSKNVPLGQTADAFTSTSLFFQLPGHLYGLKAASNAGFWFLDSVASGILDGYPVLGPQAPSLTFLPSVR